MDRKIYVIVMAAGSGTRMGTLLPKQFLDFGGKPVLQRSIEVFVRALPELRVVTVLPKEHIDYWKRCCIENDFQCPQMIVEGGFTRFHSVRNALEKIPDGAIVAVHDGVRPLVSVEKVKELFSMMEIARAVIPVVPATDTLKLLRKEGDSYVAMEGEAPDRNCIFGAQTPQIFMSEDLKAAYLQPYDMSFTDDASVAAKINIPLTYVTGERNNIKITTPEDLLLAQAYLELR